MAVYSFRSNKETNLMTDNNSQEEVVASQTNEGEGQESEQVTLSKADYAKMNETIGSMKRELKDFKRSKETTVTPTNETKTEEFGLLHKSFLRAAGITDSEEVELARLTAKKWGVGIDEVVDDEDFKVKLEKHRTNKSNTLATSNIKGGVGTQSAKNTPAYWIAKGTPPSREDVPDRQARWAINAAIRKGASNNGKQFYND